MELRRRGLWPAQLPAVVLAEALTGDHRRDFHANRLLRACQVRDVATAAAGRRRASPPGRARRPPRSPAHVSGWAEGRHAEPGQETWRGPGDAVPVGRLTRATARRG